MTSESRDDSLVEALAKRLAYAYQLGSLVNKPYPEKEKQLEAEGLAIQHWQEWSDEAAALLAQIRAGSSG